MNTIALKNNDIFLDSNGQISIFDGIKSEQQVIKSTLLTFLGECDLNTNIGIRWDDILGEKLNPTLILESVRENLEQLGFIESVKFNNFYTKNRNLIFSCEVKNKNGEVFIVSNN